jgi:hypothetical protein
VSAGNEVFVLDCEALSKAVRGDAAMRRRLDYARTSDIPVLITPLTMVEADDGKIREERWGWLLSRLQVADIGKEQGTAARRLRRETGLHGHKYVIDTFLAVVALQQRAAVTLFTSDADDMEKLLADSPHVVVVAV